jgi:hypothetical protein
LSLDRIGVSRRPLQPKHYRHLPAAEVCDRPEISARRHSKDEQETVRLLPFNIGFSLFVIRIIQ